MQAILDSHMCISKSKCVCRSRIVRGLLQPLAWIALLAVGVGIYETARDSGRLPTALPSLSIQNTDPFNLSSFALSLLLVRASIQENKSKPLIQIQGTSAHGAGRASVAQHPDHRPLQFQQLCVMSTAVEGLPAMNQWSNTQSISLSATKHEAGRVGRTAVTQHPGHQPLQLPFA